MTAYADANSFVFFALDDAGNYHGLCHGSYIETFWMTGCTCYVASLITNKEDRGKGYGKFLLDYVKEKAAHVTKSNVEQGIVAALKDFNIL